MSDRKLYPQDSRQMQIDRLRARVRELEVSLSNVETLHLYSKGKYRVKIEKLEAVREAADSVCRSLIDDPVLLEKVVRLKAALAACQEGKGGA